MLPIGPYRYGNPAAMGAGFVGPLDGYASNLPLALSVTNRLLISYTGYAFNARRSSDLTFMDVGFNADGTVNTTDFLAWVGGASAYVTKVYNQGSGGSALDAANSTAANQPRIVNAGVLDDGLFFNGLAYYLDIASQSAASYSDGTHTQVAFNGKALSAGGRIFDFGPDRLSAWCPFASSLYFDAPYPSGRISITSPVGFENAYHKTSFERNGGTSSIRVDGSAAITSAVSGTITGTSAMRIGATLGASGPWSGNIRTFVIWSDCTNAAARAAALP